MQATKYFFELNQLFFQLEVTSTGSEMDARKDCMTPILASISLDEGAALAVQWLAETVERATKVMCMGNGGSASICGHMLMDLSNASRVRTLAFHDYPMLTALTNDFGYEAAYSRCITLWAAVGDVVIAISSSGRSMNVLNAVKEARTRGCRIITLSGFAPDNPLRMLGDLNFYAPSCSYGFVEMAHGVLAHCLCEGTTLALGISPFGR